MHACLLSLVQMGSYETALSNLADSRVVVSATALQALVDDLAEVRLLLQAQRDVVQSTMRRGEAALKQFGVEVGFIDDLRVCTFLPSLCVRCIVYCYLLSSSNGCFSVLILFHFLCVTGGL